jgi:hypothetical protein
MLGMHGRSNSKMKYSKLSTLIMLQNVHYPVPDLDFSFWDLCSLQREPKHCIQIWTLCGERIIGLAGFS